MLRTKNALTSTLAIAALSIILISGYSADAQASGLDKCADTGASAHYDKGKSWLDKTPKAPDNAAATAQAKGSADVLGAQGDNYKVSYQDIMGFVAGMLSGQNTGFSSFLNQAGGSGSSMMGGGGCGGDDAKPVTPPQWFTP